MLKRWFYIPAWRKRDALAVVQGRLESGRYFAASPDDPYLITTPHAARQVAFLPAAPGGLGLASAQRLAPAACWAAWADALPVMLLRRAGTGCRCAQDLALGGAWPAPCLRAAAAVRDRLVAEGWDERPEWHAMLCDA